MQHVDIRKLGEIIDTESATATERVLYRDTFATACHLHATGHETAGLKLLRTLFDHLGRNRRQTYLGNLVGSLDGNETRYACGIGAHAEINHLFDEPTHDD